MKKGDVLEGTVIRCDYPGKGIISCEGRQVGVKGTIPGQRVRFRVKKKNSSKCEGILLEVLEPSAKEQAPDCPHFPECGGCQYRMLSYEDQLSMKEEQVKHLLKPVIRTEDGQEPRFEGIKASPDITGYRNKMEFTFGDAYKGGPLVLGLHRKGSFYDIIDVSGCRIIDEDIRKIRTAVLEVCRESGLPYYHRVMHTGVLRHLLVRKAKATGQILVDLVTVNAPLEELDGKMVEALCALDLEGTIAGILHTYNDSVADVIRSDRTELLYGVDRIEEELLGLRFSITPFSFFQTNSRAAEVLYETVRDYVGDKKDRVIFDLYSGTGTIAQVLAKVARHVTGVEIVPEAVDAARENAGRNALANCSFLCGDVLKVVDELQEKPDVIILDPPRDGIHPKAMPKILSFGVETIVYISCKATSLARDLIPLQNAGYRVVRWCAADLFPGTVHVESITLLQRMSNTRSRSITLDVDMEDYHRIINGDDHKK